MRRNASRMLAVLLCCVLLCVSFFSVPTVAMQEKPQSDSNELPQCTCAAENGVHVPDCPLCQDPVASGNTNSSDVFFGDQIVADIARNTIEFATTANVSILSDTALMASSDTAGAPEAPTDGDTSGNPFVYGTAGSNSFRIPALVTMSDGTLLAAADARWNCTYDGGGLDTIVSRSEDGGATWRYSFANYLGDNGDVYNGNRSSCFIDPALTIAGDTVYMLVDIYPYGIALNGSGNTQPSTAVGFDANGRLLLSNNNHVSYGYYLNGNTIYSSSGTAQSGYYVDGKFNIYTVSGDTRTYVSNLFFSDSPFKVVRTGFLYLTSSSDGGQTWSDPQLLNVKTSNEQVCLVAPGRGLYTSNGAIVFPVYKYNGSQDSQRMGFIYSYDGTTWSRVDDSYLSWSSESSVVELSDGTLRFFYRNGNSRLCYVDYSWSTGWSSYVNTGLVTNSNCQISAITYSKKSNGKQVILVSCPAGPSGGSNQSGASYRVNGKIFVGLVNSNNTMDWNSGTTISVPSIHSGNNFMYSCMTEQTDGSVSILYEDNENGWGAGNNCYYQMSFATYQASAFGLTFDNTNPGVETYDTITDPNTDVTIYKSGVAFTAFSAVTTIAPNINDAQDVRAYVMSPTVISGPYTGSASITVPIPSGWDISKVCGFAVNADGSVTTVEGSVANGYYTYNMPHFSTGGILLQADESGNPTSTQPVSLNVGGTQTFTVDGANYAGSYSLSPAGVATVTVTGQDETPGTPIQQTTYTRANNVYCSTLLNANKNRWTRCGSYYYTPDGTNYYPLYAKRSVNNTYTYTWGYRTNTSSTTTTTIGTQSVRRNSVGSTAPNITVYTQSTTTVPGTPGPATTSINFTGIAEGTASVTIGNVIYDVTVTALSDTKTVNAITGTSTVLNPLSVLGLSSGTATYEITSGNEIISISGNNLTAGDTTGSVTVLATVRNAQGGVLGRVTYNIDITDVLINAEKNVYVPVGSTVTLTGVSGSMVTGPDTAVATATLSGSNLTVNGVAAGETSAVYGTTRYNIYVSPNNASKNGSKHLKITVADVEHSTVYYSINGGPLFEVMYDESGAYVLMDQDYPDGFNIIFFAVPDEGYALTTMGVTDSASQYYSMYFNDDGNPIQRADAADSKAWPFISADASTIPSSGNDAAWKFGHGFRWSLMEGNMDIAGMRDLFTRARALGAHGATTFTKNGNGDNYTTNVSFISEKLPTIEKSIASVKRDGTPISYDSNTVLQLGDVVTYQFVVREYTNDVYCTNFQVSDATIGYYTSPVGAFSNISPSRPVTLTADYTINQDDLENNVYVGGEFHNTANLTYNYTSTYSGGVYGGSANASVSCKIAGMVTYIWEPEVRDITAITDQHLPYDSTLNYGTIYTTQGKPIPGPGSTQSPGYDWYDVVYIYPDNTSGLVRTSDSVGYWTFDGWESSYSNNTIYPGYQFNIPAGTDTIVFTGLWHYTPIDRYTVNYQWSGNIPPEHPLPVDTGSYETGDTYTVDSVYTQNGTFTYDNMQYTFSGWSIQGGDGTIVTGDQIMGNENVVLVGVWTQQNLSASVTINKIVTGGLGDQSKYFDFTVTSNQAMGAGTGYTLSSDGKTATFSLAHGGSVTLQDVPIGAVLHISESMADDYEMTVNAGDTTIVDDRYTVTNMIDQVLTVTNNKGGTFDTGVVLDSLPYIIILALVIVGGVLLFKKRNHRDDD